jgi:cell wall-associated NlpC family hydrolase
MIDIDRVASVASVAASASPTLWRYVVLSNFGSLPGGIVAQGRTAAAAARTGRTGPLRILLFVLLSTIAVVGLVPAAANAADRNAIVTVAQNQLNDPSHNQERGGYNCNFFTSYVGAGSGCSNGWRTEEWCADFARFVWGRAGVADTGQLNAAAYSFYAYGVNHGTWHGGDLAGLAPGDVIVYSIGYFGGGTARHVAIYVGNSLVISGNAGPNTDSVYQQLTSSLSYLGVSGYTRPV